MSYIREMDDQEKPNYKYLRQLFNRLFRRKVSSIIMYSIRRFESLRGCLMWTSNDSSPVQTFLGKVRSSAVQAVVTGREGFKSELMKITYSQSSPFFLYWI